MPISLLLALGVVGLVFYLRGRAAEAAANRLADPDAGPLEELARAGSDLDRPHEVEFFLYLPSESGAGRVAAELRRRGFSTEVSRGDDSVDWLCLATRSLPPTLEALRALRSDLVTLAETEEGVYDGWGTTVIPVAPAS